jgi:phosphoribosylanthranilate isomerase
MGLSGSFYPGRRCPGLHFCPKPPKVDRFQARKIIREVKRELPSFPIKVGVFVNENIEEVHRIAEECELDRLQLHGQETPEFSL